MFHRIIRSSRRSFDDLSWDEIASMIEADSALSPDGNREFSGCALDEFIYSEDVRRSDLRSLQRYLRNGIYRGSAGDSEKHIDKDFLRAIVVRIRSGQTTPDRWD